MRHSISDTAEFGDYRDRQENDHRRNEEGDEESSRRNSGRYFCEKLDHGKQGRKTALQRYEKAEGSSSAGRSGQRTQKDVFLERR